MKRGIDPLAVIAGAKAYATQCHRAGTEPRYVAQAVTWLNQERWSDDYSPVLQRQPAKCRSAI